MQIEEVRLPPAGETSFVAGPLKAYTNDGRLLLFPRGARLEPNRILGQGVAYDVTLNRGVPVGEVAGDRLSLILGLREEGANRALTTSVAVVTVAGLATVGLYAARVLTIPALPS